MTPFKIGYVAVVVVWAEDMQAAAHFYHRVLGLPLLHDESHSSPHRRHFRLGQGVLFLLKGTPQPALDADPPHYPLFALTVDDLDAAAEHLKVHSVDMPRGIQGEHPRWIMLHDPAGNLIELVEAH